VAQHNVSRVHGYTRVSSLEQAREGYSLGEQERLLREIADRHHPDREFLLWSDPGVSGSVPLAERPEGGTMVTALRGGDLVIATKLDRVFRDMRDALNQVEEFRTRQIDCILLDICPDLKSITGQTSAGQFNFQVLAAAAQFERSRLRERLADSREARRRQGKPLGGNPPVGWSIENGFLVRNEHEQTLLELIHTLRREGRSLSAIADELEMRGYRTRSGNLIGSSQISKFVRAQPSTSQLDKQCRADRIKAAIATKRAQGWKPGNPRLGEAAKHGTAMLIARREQRDALMEPIIAKILATSVNSYQGVAAMLNAAQIPTHGNAAKWYPATVRQIMRRLNLYSPHQPGRPKTSGMTGPVAPGQKPPTTALTTPLRRFREKRKQHILALREDGLSVPEIARELKLRNDTMIYRILHEAEMPVGLQRAEAKEPEIDKLRAAGRSVAEIGTAIGFHPRTIYRFLERRRCRKAATEDGRVGFTDEIMPMIWKLQAAGVVGRRALARELNESGVPARHGGRWTPGTVARLIARHKSQQPVDLETQQAAGFALGVLTVINELRAAGFITLQSLTDELNKRGLRTIKGQFWTPPLVSAVCARAGWQLSEP
jgi:putative DNA-invertase from lambdoid prophage Rac